MILALSLVMAGLPAAPYSASTLSGAVIASECVKSEGLELDPCVAYILGAADTLAAQHTFCLAGSSWTAQVVAVSKRYLAGHPEQWDKQPAFLIRRALSIAFPCQASGQK